MSINHDTLNNYVKDGLLYARHHNSLPLTIYNYTPIVQYKRLWDDVTMQCRGLIIADDGEVVARPFKKFFNVEEHEQYDDLPKLARMTYAYEKGDGSLGIIFYYANQWRIATRGSFHSEQAAYADTNLMHQIYDGLTDTELTYLFEIIYPENRIVVDYGDQEGLMFLSAFTKDGEDVGHLERGQFDFPWMAKRMGLWGMSLHDIREYYENDYDEGLVVVSESGQRAKMKWTEYVRRHKILTNLTTRTVFNAVSTNALADLLADVPDEFYEVVANQAAFFNAQFEEIERDYLTYFKTLSAYYDDRKTFAEHAQRFSMPSILFKMLDDQDYSDIIWKSIYPKQEKLV